MVGATSSGVSSILVVVFPVVHLVGREEMGLFLVVEAGSTVENQQQTWTPLERRRRVGLGGVVGGRSGVRFRNSAIAAKAMIGVGSID